jgi:hypothetical protein
MRVIVRDIVSKPDDSDSIFITLEFDGLNKAEKIAQTINGLRSYQGKVNNVDGILQLLFLLFGIWAEIKKSV